MIFSHGTAMAATQVLMLMGVPQGTPNVATTVPLRIAQTPAFFTTSQIIPDTAEVTSKVNAFVDLLFSRQTTPQEALIGDLRAWFSLPENWDGEGAARPSRTSIQDAVSFARLLDANFHEPEPMLLANGHASLFWDKPGLYADLEFLGNQRVAYFIEKNKDKHKGVVKFELEKIHGVFQNLLTA
jgi:hypothetical protein